MTWICISLIGVALIISLPASWLMIGFGRLVGQVDRPESQTHKADGCAIATTGGTAIFIALVGPLVAAIAAVWFLDQSIWQDLASSLVPHIPGLRQQTPLALGIMMALLCMHILGWVDDRRGLSAVVKLMVQVLVAALLAMVFDVRIFHFLDQFLVGGWFLSVLVSVGWIVAITNAMNMLDNMDGLSAGVGTIAASVFLAATLLNGQWFIAGLCALLIGGLLGFLVFNMPPARLYMGDGGSLVLGLSLAVISVRTTYYVGSGMADPNVASMSFWYAVLMPLLVMAVPLYDLVSVILIRAGAGQHLMVGDQNHFSHRLVRRGLTKPAAVCVVYLATLATATAGVILPVLNGWQAMLVAGQVLSVIGVLVLLERT